MTTPTVDVRHARLCHGDPPRAFRRRAHAAEELEHLAVDPDVVRTGIGAALVEAVRTAGKEAGCASLVTDVWNFNDGALAFFDALGLTPMRHWLERPS
ncbi:GNAT family N-acetyltransferase [Nonomuraea sp. KC401]|uniref:GNAT family N-acetyltransferase n=1 Tax=unclassified Nonomuraea TaxID=2593643 RepID=UPI0010FDA663|nr:MULTISPECIES: GNAT family N-acetyltransferase [unclassified Nonomuraea]NBE93117.1 GNAT family N-acetyltransferase [Nonomuraea sp. K271]TLF82896.1 GNAT family N-acetyltransferase [Nonomuraea sp. KC401]